MNPSINADMAATGAPIPSQNLTVLAERIRTWRKRHGFTQAELAVQSGISVSFISMIERAERSPSYDTLLQLAQALDISLAELFRMEGETAREDGYYRKLSDFGRAARLSRKQVEQLISVGEALFGRADPESGIPADRMRVAIPERRRCSVEGCQLPMLAKGLCSSHYRRELRQRGKL